MTAPGLVELLAAPDAILEVPRDEHTRIQAWYSRVSATGRRLRVHRRGSVLIVSTEERLTGIDDLRARFLERVEPEPNSGCWFWLGGFYETSGYGNCRILPGVVTAHRTAYHLFIGDPGAAMVLHTCDQRRCVNPPHLYLGDHAQNMRDMVERGRADDRRGERNTGVKITVAVVRSIRARFETGARIVDIAGEHELEYSHVQAICSRRIWCHV